MPPFGKMKGNTFLSIKVNLFLYDTCFNYYYFFFFLL